MRTKKQAQQPPQRARRPTITVDLGPEVLDMLDQCAAILRTISVHRRGSRAITRSYVVRQAIERLWDALTFDSGKTKP